MDASEEAPEPVAANDTTPQESSSKGQDKEDPKKNNVRKRTKTGCLTCRKRRIKCDEGKPVCNNCTKSKRTCEGYIQRVVFKDPIGYQTPFSGRYIYHPGAVNTFHPHLADNQQRASISHGPLQVIAPKPPHLEFQSQPGGFMDPPPYQVPSGLPSTAQLNSGHLYPPNSAAPQPNSAQINPPGVWPQDEQYGFNLPMPQHSANGGYKNSNPSPAPAMHPMHTTGEGVSAASLNAPGQPVNLSYEELEEECMDESDDDMEMIGQPYQHQEGNQLGLILARRMDVKMDTFGIEQRTFGYEDNILSSYMPSMRASLLRDPATADVFRHFIQVTGPSMSLYERHPYDPSPIFHGQPVPKSRQHIWTYAFPLLALGHPGLLHAMLALGSLQMAKYQGVPPTASLKHYHLALTRVKKNINSPLRRTQPATLAATLLLGYFEVWSSDHDKWCKHLLGSRLIIKEIPYAEMTRAYLAARHKKRQRLNTQTHQAQQYYGLFPGQQEPAEEVEDNQLGESDLDFVYQLTGRPLAYKGPDGKTPPFTNTDKNIEVYRQYADLYWWYCKMDVYQSILSGTKLFMDFRLWTQCLPRAPIGRINEIYGTYDHLMLLLGRTTSFAAFDLARKRKSMANRTGGPPGMGGQGGNNRPSLPSFPGMLPRGKISTNLGFSPSRESSPQSDDAEDIDLEASTAAAMREWEAIRQAYEIYRLRMTDEFQPLTDEFQAARQSPFGPVRTYRTSSIAGIWMNYYMGLIVLYRAHPTMPPVAMLAAGRMAKETAEFAAEIGRIAAGLSDDTSHSQQIPTLVAAAWIESSFCLFVAAIQYQDAAQRDWLIRRMLDIARLTGWQSAKQIAGGCESAWSKAGEMGRGPPYERREGILVVETSSVWVNPRRIDRVIREAGDTEQRLVLHKSEQAHYALGLLGVEQDLDKLDLQDSH